MSSAQKPKVMVCEDEHLIALFIVEELLALGAEVVGPFARAEDALKAIEQHRPDCVVLDMILADGNSAALARRLAITEIPFLVFCALPARSYPEIAALAARWLMKPQDTTIVAQAVTALAATSA